MIKKTTTCLLASLSLLLSTAPILAKSKPAPKEAEISGGVDAGDIRGSDNKALQAAVEYVASLGGGTVRIGPGKYVMRNALTLRDNVRVIGTPGKTILSPVDGLRVKLATDGDCNQRELTLTNGSGFKVGDRVLVSCDRYPAYFLITAANLTAKLGPNRFRIDEPFRTDYQIGKNARAELNFPCVGGWGVKNASVEGITIEGNRDRTQCTPMDGCRHGGIYLFECENVAIRKCIVRRYNGDGISFQVSKRITVEDCVSENNAGLGLHPGSGSGEPLVRNCRATGNESDGMFVCWRVKHGRFEGNELRDNKRDGISIGHKDTDNVFLRNIITGNARIGLLFRDEPEPLGAHRNRFEKNVILDNGSGKPDESPVVIRGTHHNLVFRNNRIGFTNPSAKPLPAILTNPKSKQLDAKQNEFPNVKQPIRQQD